MEHIYSTHLAFWYFFRILMYWFLIYNMPLICTIFWPRNPKWYTKNQKVFRTKHLLSLILTRAISVLWNHFKGAKCQDPHLWSNLSPLMPKLMYVYVKDNIPLFIKSMQVKLHRYLIWNRKDWKSIGCVINDKF